MPAKGKTNNPNGRTPGIQNKATRDFKEAVNNLLEMASPRFVEWLDRVAATDPAKALDTCSKLAEYAFPKLARTEMTGKDGSPIQVAWPLPKTKLDD